MLGIVVVSGVSVACNAIVGVEDVKYRGSAISDAGSVGDDDTNTDPDPTPTKPAPPTDAGATDSGVTAACNGAIACERLVFVTHTSFDGNLGGVIGADAACTTAGGSIPGYAGRKFVAWLSNLAKDADQRVVHGSLPYRRVDRSIFANSYADMIDGTVNLPLFLDETGAALTGTALERSVWSGTGTNGVWNGNTCNDWGSNLSTDTGNYGDSQMADQNWTQVPGPASSTCDLKKHVYCIEQ